MMGLKPTCPALWRDHVGGVEALLALGVCGSCSRLMGFTGGGGVPILLPSACGGRASRFCPDGLPVASVSSCSLPPAPPPPGRGALTPSPSHFTGPAAPCLGFAFVNSPLR